MRKGTSSCTLAEGELRSEALHSWGALILRVEWLGFVRRGLPGFHLSQEAFDFLDGRVSLFPWRGCLGGVCVWWSRRVNSPRI